MKKSTFLLALLICLSFSAAFIMVIMKRGASMNDTVKKTLKEIAKETVQPVTDDKTIEKWDTYSDTWVAADELGRTLPTYKQTGPVREGKFVGIHYLLWQNDLMRVGGPGKARNITDILTNNPAALNDPNSPEWGPPGTFFWGKPLFGYYNLNIDKYVLKKHAQMLSDIGIDTLIIDCTNFIDGNELFYNWKALMNLCQSFTEVREAGGKTPQFMFMMTWFGESSANGVKRIYNDLYSKNLYPDLWFKWEGKPLILADYTAITDQTLLDFFTLRSPHPHYTPPDAKNDWPWLSITPQQPAYTDTNPAEEVAVGPAQNWAAGPSYTFMSAMDAKGNFIARGRSYHNSSEPMNADPVSSSYPSKYGYNFQEGLDRALEIDPSFLFITAWNEWIAGRFTNNPFSSDKLPAGGGFCDLFTPEFSRDLEPTLTGGLGDNYYMQLAAAIRKFKGVRSNTAVSSPRTISINGDFTDWEAVQPEFRDDIGDKATRDYTGIFDGENYVNNTGRNDFKQMKVAHDQQNMYFYVETVKDISSYKDPNWMRLFIKTNDSDANWEGYNYILNRSGVTESTTTLEKSTGGWSWSVVNSNIKYKVKGNQMELAIPRSDLGTGDISKPLDIQFKWNDNMQNQGDIYEFYLSGDTAPNGRFNYRYTEKQLAESFIRDLSAASTSASDMPLAAGETAGTKFSTTYDFNSIEVQVRKQAVQNGNVTLALYKWDTDYNTTITRQPVVTKIYRASGDENNSWLRLDVSRQSPGEYLWVATASGGDVTLSICNSGIRTAEIYYNSDIAAGSYVSRIYCME